MLHLLLQKSDFFLNISNVRGIFCSSIDVDEAVVTLKFDKFCEFESYYCDSVSDICFLSSQGAFFFQTREEIHSSA